MRLLPFAAADTILLALVPARDSRNLYLPDTEAHFVPKAFWRHASRGTSWLPPEAKAAGLFWLQLFAAAAGPVEPVLPQPRSAAPHYWDSRKRSIWRRLRRMN